MLDVHWKNWCWSWNSSTLATWCKELTHWKRPWCWEGLGAEGKGDDRGWDGWMASPTRWAWVWVSSGSLWQTGRPGMLQFMGSQRVGHNWSTELNWTDYQRIHKNNPDAFKCTDLGSNLVLTFFKLYYLVAILYCVLFHASLFLLTANHSPPICAFYKTFSS